MSRFVGSRTRPTVRVASASGRALPDEAGVPPPVHAARVSAVAARSAEAARAVRRNMWVLSQVRGDSVLFTEAGGVDDSGAVASLESLAGGHDFRYTERHRSVN